MNTDFKIGDVVRLNSGGPDMTIARFEDDVSDATKKNAFAFCGWFEGKKLHQKTFPLEMLELVAK